MSSGAAAPLFRRALSGWVFFLAVVLSRLFKVPLLPWHLWLGWWRWHLRIGRGPRQRLATRLRRDAGSWAAPCLWRAKLKALLLHREASRCRVHEEEGNGMSETWDAAARSAGPYREVFLAKQSPWVLEEADCLQPGLAGQEGMRCVSGLTRPSLA